MTDGLDPTQHGVYSRPTDEFDRPSPTALIPVAPTRGSSQIALAAIAVAAAGFLVGIAVASIGSIARDQPEGTVLADADIGPDGGTIRFDGGQLRIPEGALAESVKIVVRASSYDDRVTVDAAADAPLVFEPGTLRAYLFEPADATFRQPAELTFRLPADARNGTVFAMIGSRIVLLEGTIDIDRETANISVRNFRFDATFDQPEGGQR